MQRPFSPKITPNHKQDKTESVTDVRVFGGIGVVELDRIDDLDALRARFLTEGVFVRPFGNIVYLTPAFTIAPDELQRLIDAVVKVVGELKA